MPVDFSYAERKHKQPWPPAMVANSRSWSACDSMMRKKDPPDCSKWIGCSGSPPREASSRSNLATLSIVDLQSHLDALGSEQHGSINFGIRTSLKFRQLEDA